MRSNRRNVLKRIGTVSAGTVGITGLTGRVSASSGGISLRGFRFNSYKVPIDSEEMVEIEVEINNSFDEEKVVHVLPTLIGQGHSERMYLDPMEYGGNMVSVPPNETETFYFDWGPSNSVQPGIYNVSIVLNDSNKTGFWESYYDSWHLDSVVAVGLEVETDCYRSVEDYMQTATNRYAPITLVGLIAAQADVVSDC